MKIVVNHLTRMQPGFICVAGIDMETRQHVRPVIAAHRRMESFLLASRGGVFDIGAIIDIGDTRDVGHAPHVEDHEFDWMRARLVKYVEPDRFWRMLRFVLKPSFEEVFGHPLSPNPNGTCRLPLGAGTSSLGCIAPHSRPSLQLVERDGRAPSIRMTLNESDTQLNLSVTDVRLCGPDCSTPDPAVIEPVASRLESGIGCILSVGLTRPFPKTPDETPEHWVQVNNIHLEDDPGWRLSQ